MAEEVKIHGLDDVRRALKRLPKEIRKREVQKALRPGAKVIQAMAKQLAPTGEGFLRKIHGNEWLHFKGTLANSIVIRAEKKRFLLDTARLRVGVLSSSRDINIGAWYWRFVEFGTSKMTAKPFLVPAFERTKYVADKLIKKALLQGVERQARRVKK